jgi:hypothetical protein
MPAASPRKYLHAPFAHRFEGVRGRRLLWLGAGLMLVFGVAELPALARMSAHGTGVLGFEFAGSTHRMREILASWGSAGRGGAREHVFIDLGFIVGYALLLVGACGPLAGRFDRQGHPRAAAVAALLAWAALTAATINALQKVLLWLEIHGHIAQPLPALAAVCGAITFALATSAALFAAFGAIATRRLSASATSLGQPR